MPGRKFSAGGLYRYGYNGKELDKDISNDAYDYGMRISDQRLGRFLSVDPITAKYPELTPYQYASNRPIDGIDEDGLEYLPAKDNPDISCTQQNDDCTYSLTVGGVDVQASSLDKFNGKEYYNLKTNLYCTSAGVSTSGKYKELITQQFVTRNELGQIFPNGNSELLDNTTSLFNSHMYNYGIRTPEALAHLLGQVGGETGGLINLNNIEDLDYRAKRLTEVWPSRFILRENALKTGNPLKLNIAEEYEHNPVKLANSTYSNRMGNGDEASGDGYKFLGRGMIGLTGRGLATQFQNHYNNRFGTSINIVTSPELIGTNVNYAAISAMWYFHEYVIGKTNIQTASMSTVTRLVNGGQTGIEARTKFHAKALKVLVGN